MAAIGIIGNLMVLFGRLLARANKRGCQVEHSLYLRHLAASDLIMGIYLAVIAVVDIMYRYLFATISDARFYFTRRYLSDNFYDILT